MTLIAGLILFIVGILCLRHAVKLSANEPKPEPEIDYGAMVAAEAFRTGKVTVATIDEDGRFEMKNLE